jgi:hypothetical protein
MGLDLRLHLRLRGRRPIEVVEQTPDLETLPDPWPAAVDERLAALALPPPPGLPRRTRPDELAATWTARLKTLAVADNRTARGLLRRLSTARRTGQPGLEAERQHREARELVAAFEAMLRHNQQQAWRKAEADGVELTGLKAIADRGAARVRDEVRL